MLKKTGVLFVSLILGFLLSGCATGRKQKDLEIQGLKNQVTALEAQIQGKDEEINSLKEALNKSQEEKKIASQNFNKKGVIPKTKRHPSVRQIQIALKNAGYNPGPIDGKMGAATRESLKSFQKANNLTPTGKANRKTWQLLSKYLYEKVK